MSVLHLRTCHTRFKLKQVFNGFVSLLDRGLFA